MGALVITLVAMVGAPFITLVIRWVHWLLTWLLGGRTGYYDDRSGKGL